MERAEITKETFDKNDILNLKLTEQKILGMIKNEYIASIIGTCLFLFLAIFSIWSLVWNINFNKDWYNDFGEYYQDGYFWGILFMLLMVTLFLTFAFLTVRFKIETDKDMEDVRSEIEKVKTYEDYMSFKEWLINNKQTLIKRVNRISKWWGRNNGMAKGLIIGSFLF